MSGKGKCKYCPKLTEMKCGLCGAYVCVFHIKITTAYAMNERNEQVVKLPRCKECYEKKKLPLGYREL